MNKELVEKILEALSDKTEGEDWSFVVERSYNTINVRFNAYGQKHISRQGHACIGLDVAVAINEALHESISAFDLKPDQVYEVKLDPKLCEPGYGRVEVSSSGMDVAQMEPRKNVPFMFGS